MQSRRALSVLDPWRGAHETNEPQPTAKGEGSQGKPALMVKMTEAEVKELPKAIVQRPVKSKLVCVVMAGPAKGEGQRWSRTKMPWPSLLRVPTSSSTTYLPRESRGRVNPSNAQDGKRQMTDAEVVFKAFDGIEFSEFVEHRRTALEGHCCCLHVFSILLQTTVLAQLCPSSMCSLSFDVAWINDYAIMQMNGTLAQFFILMARIWELLELLLPNCSDHIIDQLAALHYSTNNLESWRAKLFGYLTFTSEKFWR